MEYKVIIFILAAIILLLLLLLLRLRRPKNPPDAQEEWAKYEELLGNISVATEEKQNLDMENLRLREKNDNLMRSLQEHQMLIEQQEKTASTLTASYDARVAREKQKYENILETLRQDFEHQKIVRNAAYTTELTALEDRWQDERARYLAAIAIVQNALTEDEDAAQRHINVGVTAQEDISYLINAVASRLKNPDVLYKLIWTEFIQKPTNEMLNYVLPQKDCAGIYKITNDRNKKAYIGRSTSVRKRLTDHIKSAVGISTIADQRIHQVMREEGLWNFTFELIEECDKDQLNEREKFYISTLQTEQLGYNQKAGG